VLPTGVETSLPFACNAPFIQDPARLKIKDPETSPTNRWLLKRVDELAGMTMLNWLRDTSLDLSERSRAYGLFPDGADDDALGGACTAMVAHAFDNTVEGKPYVLTDGGKLRRAGECVILPDALFDVWPSEQATYRLVYGRAVHSTQDGEIGPQVAILTTR
jgi:hypothetical protein